MASFATSDEGEKINMPQDSGAFLRRLDGYYEHFCPGCHNNHIFLAIGSAAGAAVVTGIGAALVIAIGTAAGTSTAAAIGSAANDNQPARRVSSADLTVGGLRLAIRRRPEFWKPRGNIGIRRP